MTLRRVARPRLLGSHCLLENSRGCFREIALFPILLFFRFALRFGHVESCHRSTLREILKFKLTHYPISCPSESEVVKRLHDANCAELFCVWKVGMARHYDVGKSFRPVRYGEPDAIPNTVGYARFYSCSHDAVIRVYDAPAT